MYPDAARRVATEAAEVLGDGTPNAADIERLAYTGKVVKESLRLFPPGWLIVRTPHRDDVLGGYRVPAGAPVILSQ